MTEPGEPSPTAAPHPEAMAASVHLRIGNSVPPQTSARTTRAGLVSAGVPVVAVLLSAAVLTLASVALATPARALDCNGAAAFLFPDDAEARAQATRPGSLGCAVARWGGPGSTLWSAAAPRGAERLAVAIVREEADGSVRPVAGPVETEPLTIDPLGSPLVRFVPDAWFGNGQEAVALTVSNSYTSTGRSTSTTALHLFLRRGGALVLVFAAYTDARHAYEVPCTPRRAAAHPQEPCRRRWARAYRVEVAARHPGTPPDLLVRDRRTGRVVSRHRWSGQTYQPPTFDRTPPLGEG